jgi:carboxypeptidase PM20D1
LFQAKIILFFLPAIIFIHPSAAQTPPELQRLSKAIQIQTISGTDSATFNPEHFKNFISFLQENFPLTHQRLEWKTINDYSLVYHWKGSGLSGKPVLLLAHYDVVPAEEKSLSKWQNPPFSGHIDSLFIWGRGTLDDKSSVMAMLESTENLLKENFLPSQTIYFAFGHDEEIGGYNGAKKIAEYFQNLEFQMVLDEGGMMAKDLFPGMKKTIAFISTAEKGDLNVELSVHEKGGHSAAPPKETAIEIIAKALIKINEHPMKARLQSPTDEMLKTLAPHLDAKTRFALRNRWLFKKKILKKLSDNYGTNSIIRTVMSPTMINGGIKENSLPAYVAANINIRALQGDSIGTVLQHLKNTIKDERVMISVKEPYHYASAITPTDSKEYSLISKTILQIYPDVVVAPLLAPGTTDSRKYASLSKNILRFIPVTLDNESKEQMHGINERISLKEYMQAIRFYTELIKNINKEY